jgi:hypothetical protein
MVPFKRKRSFSAAVSIRAPQERIWPILTDASAYPEWNPTIDHVEGNIAEGERLKVFPKGSSATAFSVVVEEVAPGRKMVWRGGMPFGSLIGRRTFVLRPHKDGTVEFEMRESYTGWLARWMRRMVPDLQSSFEQFAVALKRRAEQNGPCNANLG